MLTQTMLCYLKIPKPGNNSGANYPRDIKFCTRTQVWWLNNIMKRIPVFLLYFNMPPFTPMLTQTMLFYLKRPKPGNNSGANYPRDIKFCTRTQVWWLHNIMKNNSGANNSRDIKFLHKNSGLVATQYYEKNSGLSALFQYAPITPMLKQTMLFYLKRPKPEITPVQIIPKASNFAQELRFRGYTI